jgi:RNA polymerase sigma factor for flagellar operon FliA
VGAVGLLSALQKNEGADRGAQFEWYARVRIRGAILDELRSQDWLSRGARAAARAEAETTQRSSPMMMVSFEDLPEHKRLIPTCENESPLGLAERNSQRIALTHAVAQLPEREAKIVELHYFQGVQFKEIAAQLKVSEPRISQLHARAMTMLREVLREEEV